MSFGLGNSSSSPGVAASTAIDASTPYMAASDGNLSLLQSSLTSLKLPITARDENGYTLLQAAASYNRLDVLQWLLSSCSPPADGIHLLNAVDNDGDSALHYAATSQVAQFLITSGIDHTLRNQKGQTALESKQEELKELQDDEEYEEDDEEAVALRDLIAYLSTVTSNPQDSIQSR